MRKGPGKATKAIWDEFSGHYLENFCVELESLNGIITEAFKSFRPYRG